MPEDQRGTDRGRDARIYNGPPLEELAVGYGQAKIQARGTIVASLILTIATIGAVIYFHKEQAGQHSKLADIAAAQVCINLYDFAERKSFREAWKRDREAPKFWCPEFSK